MNKSTRLKELKDWEAGISTCGVRAQVRDQGLEAKDGRVAASWPRSDQLSPCSLRSRFRFRQSD
ncbi:hypothetical protein CCMA1212_004237, partial [Trichoderma ghanense]